MNVIYNLKVVFQNTARTATTKGPANFQNTPNRVVPLSGPLLLLNSTHSHTHKNHWPRE